MLAWTYPAAWPEVGPRQVSRPQLIAQGSTDGGKSLGPASEQKAVLKQLSLGKLQNSERQRDDRRVETTGKETRNEVLPRCFDDIDFNAWRGVLQTLQDPRKQIGGKRGDDPDRNAKRSLLETLSHRLEKQCLVKNPKRLLVGVAPEWSEEKTAAFPLDQPPSEGRLKFSDLERQRWLGHVNALGRAAE